MEKQWWTKYSLYGKSKPRVMKITLKHSIQFLDFQQAYDRMKRDELYKAVAKVGVQEKSLSLTKTTS